MGVIKVHYIRVDQNHIQCTYGIFGREINKYNVQCI